jgi:hypothetical protein
VSRRRIVYALAPPRVRRGPPEPSFLSRDWPSGRPWGRLVLELDEAAMREATREWLAEREARERREERARQRSAQIANNTRERRRKAG